MQKLTCTAEQRDRLLEMCKALFPEYSNWKYGRNWDSDELWFANENQSFEIHWFEFCSTHLLNKLCKNLELTPIEIVTFIGNYSIVCFNNLESLHPIDYLYNEFKKLK